MYTLLLWFSSMLVPWLSNLTVCLFSDFVFWMLLLFSLSALNMKQVYEKHLAMTQHIEDVESEVG